MPPKKSAERTDPVLYTPEQAAKVLTKWGIEVEASTLANWRSLGKGPTFVKVVGRVRYFEADLKKFIEDSRTERA